MPMFEQLPARLDLLPPAELDPAQRALYDAITGGPRASQAGTVPITDADGQLLGPFAVMLLSPEVGNAMQQVGAKIRFGAALTGRERELAILSVAGVLRSDFERLAHEPAARALGLAQEQIDAVLAGQIPDGLSADEVMVGRLARAMTVMEVSSVPELRACALATLVFRDPDNGEDSFAGRLRALFRPGRVEATVPGDLSSGLAPLRAAAT